MTYRVLDLFCGAGGSAVGLHRAGFEVIGIDLVPQPHYPFEFHLGDAMTYPLEGFDAYWASPPCQGYSIMRNLPWLRHKVYPLLIDATRERLEATGKPYIIENVMGAHLAAGWLCGTMFGLPFYRHRAFETNFFWLQPGHPKHRFTISPGRNLGEREHIVAFTESRARKTGQRYGFDKPECAVGHAKQAGVSARDTLEVSWMTRDEATQAIPPIYAEFLGKALARAVKEAIDGHV